MVSKLPELLKNFVPPPLDNVCGLAFVVEIKTFSELSIVIAVASELSSIPLLVNVVNVPAAAVEPPMTVLSMVPPSISGVLMSGLVSVLLVSVCEPVRVATVLSISKVTALPDPLVSIPVPPVNVRVSESKSMLSAPPESAWKSRS